MKTLFISSRSVLSRDSGGDLVTNRNYTILCKLTGEKNVTVINMRDNLGTSLWWKIRKRLNYLRGFNEGLDQKELKKILAIAAENDIVFIECSELGVLARHLRKNGYKGKIITFFHNVEYILTWQRLRYKLLYLWFLPVIYYNEKSASDFSDSIIVLSKRDKLTLEKTYGTKRISIIPVSLPDDPAIERSEELIPETPTCLFIGSNYGPNIRGIKWFIDNVVDSVDINLKVVGKGPEILNDQIRNPKVEILGFVENLSELINSADLMVFPIFEGGGMKVKTCQALMFGKNILGTTEAFQGYDIDTSKAGAVCDTKEEFIGAIRQFSGNSKPRFNAYNRDVYLERYSDKANFIQMEKLLFKGLYEKEQL